MHGRASDERVGVLRHRGGSLADTLGCRRIDVEAVVLVDHLVNMGRFVGVVGSAIAVEGEGPIVAGGRRRGAVVAAMVQANT